MQNFKELYKELADKITDTIPEVRWVDLWNSQVYNLENEHPFPTPAVFIAFRSNQMQDAGVKVQNVVMQVDFFIYYETFLDTFKGAYNQTDALGFLDLLDNLNAVMHGSAGVNYSSMRRTNLSPVDTGGAGNLFNLTYQCHLMDYSAVKNFEEGGFSDVKVEDNSFDL